MVLSGDNDMSRKMVVMCYKDRTTTVNPIIDWTDRDVWDFLSYYGCKSNPLYECGFKRIGCIGCPMASKTRYMEFRLYPKYRENYIKAFDRMIIARKRDGLPVVWSSGEDCFKWWMQEDPNQMSFDMYQDYQKG